MCESSDSSRLVMLLYHLGQYGLAYGYRGLAYQLAGDGERAVADYTKALTLLENVGQRRWVMEKLAALIAR